VTGQRPSQSLPPASPDEAGSQDLLPDFCRPYAVFLLIVLGLLIALAFSLAGRQSPAGFWLEFGLTTLVVEWIVLSTALVLCALRGWLADRIGPLAPALVFLAAVLVTVLVSLIAAHLAPGRVADPIWFFWRNLVLGALAAGILVRYWVVYGRWKRGVRAQSQARLQALQARIRPHFLFNTLNTIAELVHQRPASAEQALLDVAELLRAGLNAPSVHSLARELELIRGYLRIEALRLGARLEVDWEIDRDIDQSSQVPALLIQPLVENAIVHGIAGRAQGGRLSVRIHPARFGYLRVVVENPLADASTRPTAGAGLALENIGQRLALAFEEAASLRSGIHDGLYRAELTFPLALKAS